MDEPQVTQNMRNGWRVRHAQLEVEYCEWEKAERASGKRWAEIESFSGWIYGRMDCAESALAAERAKKAIPQEVIHMRCLQLEENLRGELAEAEVEVGRLRAVISTPEVYAGVVTEECEKHWAELIKAERRQREQAEFDRETARENAAELEICWKESEVKREAAERALRAAEKLLACGIHQGQGHPGCRTCAVIKAIRVALAESLQDNAERRVGEQP